MKPLKGFMKRQTIVCSLGVLVFLSFIPPLAPGARTIDSGFNNDGSNFDQTNQRKIVRDSSGNWYVVYGKRNGSTLKYEVKVARWADGSSWSTATLFEDGGIILDDSASHFSVPSIDVNSDRDQIHLVKLAYVSSSYYVYYAKCTNLTNWNASSGWSQADGAQVPGTTIWPRTRGGSGSTRPAVAVARAIMPMWSTKIMAP